MDELLESVADTLTDAGCAPAAVEKAERLLTAGNTEALLRHLRLCRCGLMEELHEKQKRVDRMDQLIRRTEKATAAK